MPTRIIPQAHGSAPACRSRRPSLLARHLGEAGRAAVERYRCEPIWFDATPLSRRDRDDLEKSGLWLKTIYENGICTDGAALRFPYRQLDGKLTGFCRTRPHNPRPNEKGKPIKYEQPKGEAPRAYFPTATLAKLRDGSCPIFVTEGEKKSLALSQLELAAIGIGGVWCWKKTGTDELIGDLAAIGWRGRDVYIVFDYDAKTTTQRNVKMAASRMADALRIAGARNVFNVQLPPDQDGEKQGVDDYLVASGAKAFRELIAKSQPFACSTSLSKASGRTDAANSKRFVEKFRDRVRWIGEWDKWLIWDGQRWKLDKSLEIEHLGKQIAADLFRQAGALIERNRMGGEARPILSFATYSNSASGIRNMVSLARSELGVAVPFDALDALPMLLNVRNGTLDLTTGKLREHCREELLTKLAPVKLDPAAKCPQWLAFLNKIFDGNAALIGYLQRLAGYNLSGSTQEHVLPFLYGTGANGKSTFMETLMKLLGPDYAMKAAPDLLMVKRGESHPTERADLFGKRLVACIETEADRRIAEALVKEMTGGDRMRARRMRENPWEFVPTHHIWLAGNHKPTVKGTDHGIWRRFKLIPFDRVITEKEQDKRLPEKLAAELPGILNWALAGCLDWQRNGLQEPAIVQAATNEYAAEMDDVGEFIEEYCEIGSNFQTRAAELYEAYLTAVPSSRTTKQSFGATLARRGFERKRLTGGKHGWKGLRLKSAATANAARRMSAQMKVGRKIVKGGK